MKLPKHVIEEILMRIKELSDLDFQMRVWIKFEEKDYKSCYADLRDALIKDLGTEELLLEKPEEYGLTLQFQKELALMLFLLAAYNDLKLTNYGETIKKVIWKS